MSNNEQIGVFIPFETKKSALVVLKQVVDKLGYGAWIETIEQE